MKSLEQNPWQEYLLHQPEQAWVETTFTEEFWLKYAQMIEQNKQTQAYNLPTVVQDDTLPYIRVFERYWQSRDKVVTIKHLIKFPIKQVLFCLAATTWVLLPDLPPDSLQMKLCAIVMLLSLIFGAIFSSRGNPYFVRLHEITFFPTHLQYTTKTKKKSTQAKVFYHDITDVRITKSYFHLFSDKIQFLSSTSRPKLLQNHLYIPQPKDDKTLHSIRLFLEDICLVKSIEVVSWP